MLNKLNILFMENQYNNHINTEEETHRKITVPASEIIKKFRTKQDRKAFCKENSR